MPNQPFGSSHRFTMGMERPHYGSPYSPHYQPQRRSQPGCIRVRVGGMPDLDSQEEAYVLVGFGHHPVTASSLLPHEDSALCVRWSRSLDVCSISCCRLLTTRHSC